MHIPDGFLDVRTLSTAAVLSAAGAAAGLRQVRAGMPRRKIPLMGLTAAFVFAAQMLNFPVVAGTSGHLMGAVLAAVLLGPGPAILVMTSVLVLQCLLFADGGLLALGANVFNMALVAPLSGYGIYRGVRAILPGLPGRLAAVAFASWCSTVLAAVCCAGELAWSGTTPWSAAFPAMAGMHMLIGLGEAVINTLVVASLARVRPELLDPEEPRGGWRGWMAWGSVLVIGLVVFVSPFASPWPDGLERVAADLGFEHRAVPEPLLASPFTDYTVIAGLVGTVAVFSLSILLARVLVRRTEKI